MSVFKKNGKWFVRYRDINGKQREKKAGLTKAIALELERKILTDRDNQKNFGYKKKQDITFEDFVPIYIDRAKLRVKESTIKRSIYFYNRMSECFGFKLLSNLTENDFLDYFKQTKASNKSIKSYLQLFISILNEARRLNYKVAEIKFRGYKKSTTRVRYLTKDEGKMLIANSGKLKLILIMALSTGMRIGEMLALTWQNIDLKARLIHIEESKNGERRSIPINSILFNELMLIENKNGNIINLSRDMIRWYFVKALKKCNITNFRFHDLRHTFASWLAIKGVSLYTIKELLGHKSILMTQRYAHLSPDSRFSAVEKIKF